MQRERFNMHKAGTKTLPRKAKQLSAGDWFHHGIIWISEAEQRDSWRQQKSDKNTDKMEVYF